MRAGTKTAKSARVANGTKTSKVARVANGPKAKKGSPARAASAKSRRSPTPTKRTPKGAPIHAQDVMTTKPICVTTGVNLREVARLLDENEISGLPVVDDQDHLVGVISRTDILRRLLEGPSGARRDERWLDLLTADSAASVDIDAARLGTVDDLMSIDPITAKATETLATVARRMAEERVHRVVVVDGKFPIGVITTLDLLHHFPAG